MCQHTYFILPCLFLTFLLFQFPTANSLETITFLEEPKDEHYIVKKRPATITCSARFAVDISFTCGGTKIPPTSVEREDMSDDDPDVVKVSIDVSRADVNNYKKGVYWCECEAIGIDGSVAATSKRGNITIAVLKYRFMKQPTSVKATEGENVELFCEPPVGFPKPEIFWKKGKKRVQPDADARVVITDMGSLVIEGVTSEDQESYQCVVKNAAGRRESKPADVIVAVVAEAVEAEEEVSKEDSSSDARQRNVRQSKKPFFSTEPKALYFIKEKEPLIIDCGITAADIITFRCNDARMDRKRQKTRQGQDSNKNKVIQSQLKLVYSDVEDFRRRAGNNTVFQCQCVGWYQQEKKWLTILSSSKVGVVKLAYLGEDFIKEPSSMIVGVNMQARLVCEPPKGQPSPWIYWYKDDVKIDPRTDTRYRITRAGHLVIPSAQYDDAGRYQCVAENIVTKIESKTAELRVTAEPPPPTTPTTTVAVTTASLVDMVKPTFIQDLPDKTAIDSNGVAKLTCITLAATMLSIDCNSRRLAQEDFTIERKMHESGKRMIIISTEIVAGDLAANPDGYYCECIAWELSDGKWNKYNGNKGYVVEEKKIYIDEEFVYPPKDVEVYYEETAEFACEPPSGNPMPMVYWLKNGEKVNPELDSNFVVYEAGTLIIEYVRPEDAGMYTCVAENEAGSRQADAVKLTVMGIPTTPTTITTTTEADILTTTEEYDTTTFFFDDSTYMGLIEPFFVEEMNQFNYIVSGADVVLRCKIVAAKNLVFACNGLVVKESTTTGSVMVGITGHDIRENELTITAQQVKKYFGEQPYTCICKGLAQREETGEWYSVDSRPATIEKAYLRRRFAKEPVNSNVAKGDEVTLMCSPPEGVPKPTVQWIKNGYEVTETENRKLNDDGSLTITDFMMEDEGDYLCAANNGFVKRMSRTGKLALMSDMTPEPEPEPETTQKETMETTPEPTSEPTKLIPHKKGVPYISKDLHSVYYLIDGKPVNVICEATDAKTITFNCGGEDVIGIEVKGSVKEIILEDGSMDTVEVVEGSVMIYSEDVEGYPGGQFSCVCRAHYNAPMDQIIDYIESQRGTMEHAYLDEDFVQEPEDKRVKEGDFLSISCQAPAGNPAPEVTWMKDQEPLVVPDYFSPLAIIIESASKSDAGQYVCVATNVAGKRMSSPILVEVVEGEMTTSVDGMDKGDGMSETTTEIEVVEITKVPLTSDSTDEQTTPNMVMTTVDEMDNGAQTTQDVDDTTSSTMTDTPLIDTTDAWDKEEITSQPDITFHEDTTSFLSSTTFVDHVIPVTHEMMDQCPELENCKDVLEEAQPSGLPLKFFCDHINNLMHCADVTMFDCGIPMVQPVENEKSSYIQISSWFNVYCSKMVLGQESLTSCSIMTECNLPIARGASDNSTYWCRLVDSLLGCTIDSVKQCGMTQFNEDLKELIMLKKESFCPHDDSDMSMTSTMADKEMMDKTTGEPEVDASKSDDDNDASSATASVLLLALLQLTLAFFTTLR